MGKVSGVSEYAYLNSAKQNSLPQPWSAPLEPEDLDLMARKSTCFSL